MARLLALNNYHYRRGGSETVYFEHNRLLEEAGWDVVPFSMHDPKNAPTEWSRYFVDATESAGGSALGKAARGLRAVYSVQAARRIRALIAAARPDIAHAHNIYHHLSPSVLVELKRAGIPVVMTLHDLKLACPAYKMHTQGAVCEQCRGGALRNVIKNRCIKDSRAQSALIWLESTMHRLLDLYQGTVTRFIVPSRFFLRKFAEWGIDTQRFVHIPNSISIEAPLPVAIDDAFVYAGRLVPEKGVATLIRAAAAARVRLRIIGTGAEAAALQQLARETGGEIEFTGYLAGPALRTAIARARAVVVPSEWYENAPISVMEANALGRPVVGANIGGIPELIRPEDTGFVFESGNVDSLVEILARVRSMPLRELAAMGERGRAWMRTDFSPAGYRDRVLQLYRGLGIRLSGRETGPQPIAV